MMYVCKPKCKPLPFSAAKVRIIQGKFSRILLQKTRISVLISDKLGFDGLDKV